MGTSEILRGVLTKEEHGEKEGRVRTEDGIGSPQTQTSHAVSVANLLADLVCEVIGHLEMVQH